MQNRRMIWVAATVLVAVILGLSWVGSTHARDTDESGGGGEAPREGAACRVYLRGDAAGMSVHDRVIDLDNLISRSGKFVRSDGAWVVLKDARSEATLYIPRSSIMLVEVDPKASGRD